MQILIGVIYNLNSKRENFKIFFYLKIIFKATLEFLSNYFILYIFVRVFDLCGILSIDYFFD